MEQLIESLGLKELIRTSVFLDQGPLQDSFRYRAKHIGLRIANRLIDGQGELDSSFLHSIQDLLKKTPYFNGPFLEGDFSIWQHILRCFTLLREDASVWAMIKKFSPPLCHKGAERLIRETLFPESMRHVGVEHVRKAVLAAWFTLLRQTTGSCFATAPAILIQGRLEKNFFKDLYDLLTTGQLKRTFGAKQYSVPLSLNVASGELERVGLGWEKSPGIWSALKSAAIEQSALWQKRIVELGAISAEKLLRTLIMQSFDLSEEDVRDEEYLARIQMTPLLVKQTAVFYQRPTERGQKVADLKKKLTLAKLTFQSFTECALLRSWEYTLASFCDVKTEFARWNLYIGLGIHPDHKGGIGAFLYQEFNQKLQECNREIERLAQEYNGVLSRMQALEAMMRQTGDESRRQQLKAELGSVQISLQPIVHLRDELIAKSEALSTFFPKLLEQYDAKLQESFQELFDPTIVGEAGHLFDDSSAGFRLVYKHGRMDASLWTAIYDKEQYLDILREFFSNVENEIETPVAIGRNFLTEMTTALIGHLRSDEFLQGAFARAKEKGRRSPWDYVSGGTLQSLLMAYTNRDRPFTESKIIPHSAEELLQFVMKLKKGSPLLMHSPTHAFIFYPDEIHLMQPAKTPNWSPLAQEHLISRICERLPSEEQALFLHLLSKQALASTNALFRKQLVDALAPRLKNSSSLIDAVLYENAQLFSPQEAKHHLSRLASFLSLPVPQLKGSLFSPLDLYQALKGVAGHGFSAIDWEEKIAQAMRQLKLMPPCITLFADTNWSQWFFGFVLNCATSQMELWRLNRTATQGFPMTDWTEWLDSKNKAPWVVLSQPQEYL